MKINIAIESKTPKSVRVRQLEAMFDVPYSEIKTLKWQGELPIEDWKWNIGLIVGASGSGKSVIAKNLFGESHNLKWDSDSVIEDFDKSISMQEITNACMSVGFNTIPAWMRPYNVLSNGEKFRVELARRILEDESPIVIDEFTSVVDRQVAQIGCHAVQKYLRKSDKQLIAVSCHYDIIEWLQPDWIFEPGAMTFTRRVLRRRPEINITIGRVSYETWKIFAPFHYLTNELHKAARCFGLFVDDRIASFAGILHRPHGQCKDIKGLSRLVTLPDYQGLGLAFVLSDTLAAAYKTCNLRFHTYPAHPALIRAFDKSPKWYMTNRPGKFSGVQTTRKFKTKFTGMDKPTRPCATFEYIGESMQDLNAAKELVFGV